MPGKTKTTIMQWTVLILSLMLASCGGGSSGPPDETPGGAGTLEVSLTDAFNGGYQAIYITIAEVQVKKQGLDEGEAGWETLVEPGATYNLMELANGVLVSLGVGELEAGQYGQMRLILGELPENPATNILNEPHPFANYLIDSEGTSQELKVPSGYQSGIKIVRGFSIITSQATDLVLDFDAARSVVQAGKSGKWLLKPTIKVLETVENSVSGEVVEGVEPIAGAAVSAQIYNPDTDDQRDEVVVQGATVTTEEGVYKLFLPPDIYTLVVTKDGYLPACQEVEAQYFEDYPADFSLTAAAQLMTINGTVSGLATDEDAAVLSIRQLDASCGGPENVTIEVLAVNVTNGDYTITLPAGTYELVASAAGVTTQVFTGISGDTGLDFAFAL